MTKAKGKTKTEAASAALKLAAATAVTQFPMLGWQIWWEIPGVELTAAQMEAALDGNIGKAALPRKPSKRRALREALESAEKDGVITKVRESDGVLAYSLHEKIIDKANLDVELEKKNIIVFTAADGRLDVREAHKRDEIRAMFERYQSIYTDADVRAVVTRHLDATGAVSMRRSGGIYFVREQVVHDAVRAFLHAIGAVFYSIPIPDVEAAKGTMTTVVRDELKRDLELAAEEVKRLAASESENPAVYQTRVDRFKELRGKVEAYRDLLAIDAEQMGAQLTALTSEVLAALTGELAAFPQAAAFPYGVRVEYTGKSADRWGKTGTVVGYPTGKTDVVKIHFDRIDGIRWLRTTHVCVTM